MTDQELLDCYARFLPFLSKVMGEGVEIALHDARCMQQSLIAIENSLSGRKVGDPITDLVLNFYERFNKTDKPFILDYIGRDHNNIFLDSTYFIRNDAGEIIGFLCINKDMKAQKKLEQALNSLLTAFNLKQPELSLYEESLKSQVDRLLVERVDQAVQKYQKGKEQLDTSDKVAILKELKEAGLLDMKNAVNEVAELLHVSPPTVYRYLKQC